LTSFSLFFPHHCLAFTVRHTTIHKIPHIPTAFSQQDSTLCSLYYCPVSSMVS
jgi:hypothetical protein